MRRENAPKKIFAIFSINNWETDLLKGLKRLGETQHFEWDNINNFFDNKADWKKHRNRLNDELLNGFDQFYDSNANILVFIYASDFMIKPDTDLIT